MASIITRPGERAGRRRRPGRRLGVVRAVWTGTVSFGLVALPVRLYTATEEHRVTLREIHEVDGSRVQHRRWCVAEDRPIPYGEVGRGWELPDGRIVPLSDTELERLPLPTRRVAEVAGFLPAADLDPILYGKAYYAGPAGPGSGRPYRLLVEALERSGLIAIARIAIRSRERLAALRPRRGVLVVQLLLWPDEVREPEGLTPGEPAAERELRLADVLIQELTGVNLREFHDEYRQALEELVAAKLAGGEAVEVAVEPAPVVDLLAALEASVRAAREQR